MQQIEGKETIRLMPNRCPFCGRRNEPLILDAEAYYKWANREISIQDAFPDLSPDELEIILTGICPECWAERIWKVEEEADEDLVLEDRDPNETPDDVERRIMEKMDAYKAWKEMNDLREDYDWDLRDLEQRQRDLSALEILEEEERQQEQNDYLESFWQEEYCSDPISESSF